MKNKRICSLILITVTLCTYLLSGCASPAGDSSTKNNSAGNNSAQANAADTTTTDTSAANSGDVIRVGSKDFTEGLLVGEIYSLALEGAGFKVERKLNIAGSLVHGAITAGEIDLYPEYTGTGLYSVLDMQNVGSDPQVVYDTVKKEYAERFNIIWLKQSELNDTNGISIRKETADRLGIHTLSDLQANAGEIRLASQGEFELREDGLPGLAKVYGDFNFKSIKIYDSGIKYEILKNDEADVTPGYSTDAQLVNTDMFAYLEDDKGFFPPYYLAPVVRGEVLERNPEIETVLNKVSDILDTDTIIALNARVDIDKEEYEDVAQAFYDSIKDSLK